MESMNELREFAGRCAGGMGGDALRHIADKIEAEVAERYVALPTDADGEIFHIGDKVTLYGQCVYEVDGIHFYKNNVSVSYKGESGCGCDSANNFHHYHEPTVEDEWTIEDTLRELLDVHTDWLESDAPASVMKTRDEIIADYAAKIRGAE